MDVCSHVKVVVRVRPTNDNEKCENFRNVVQVVDNHMLIFDPKEQQMTSFGEPRVQNRDVNKRANKDLKFVFDNVFGEDSSQVDIFENTTKRILDGVLNGFNCTVFAYGATGAGKTHTMLGSSNDPGVMYRTMTELFNRMDQVKEEKIFDVAFSYLEVYNEQIRDLLANVGPLAVREDPSNGVVVQGLTLHQPKSAEHLLEALDYGNRNRTQHPTDMNATSSRSHAVFQIYLTQQDRTASLNPNVRVAKMSLIDLAGSERANATNAKGARQREGANINRSLLALGNVINALADPKQSKKAHIPYRDSKLTRLLKDSLGGNCRTVMIANISPSSKSYDDTHNTLKYANRAKEIKSSLKRNVVSLDSHIGQYAVICERQREEIIQLKKKLKENEERKMDPLVPGVSNTISSQNQTEIHKVSESLQSIFSSRTQIRREHLVLERQLKENELRQRHSEECIQQAQLFGAKDKTEKATCKHERKLASLLTQQQHIRKRLKEVELCFLENEGWLHRVENDLKLLGQDTQPQVVLQKDLRCHRLQLQVEDLKQHIEQMTHLIGIQDQENKQTKKMVHMLLPAYSRQYWTLRGSGLVTAADEAENQDLEHLVLRERGVVWADQEKAGEQKDEETQAEGSRLRPELVPILSFSHLICPHQNSPCSSAEKHKRRVSLRLQPNPSSKGPAAQVTVMEPIPKKHTRRKLAVSPPNPGSVASAQAPMVLQEVLRQEGMFPLLYTPDASGTLNRPSLLPLQHYAVNDPNMTFDIEDEDNESALANATVVLYQCSPNHQAVSSCPLSPSPQQAPRANDMSKPPKRLEIPSLLDIRHGKTYMAMTSAAQGKRKMNCSSREQEILSAPKHIKQDPTVVARPLRVRLFAGSEENKPRRVMRSVSEGNLHLMDVQRKKSIFYKTSQKFKSVTKRM
ncbi:kinesin-like protein KIF18A isoform X1 [Oncorhynchus mykiss]|uniref:Kinesin-like protein n=1 Tax=Oncorhynchus mykiss TaxID=8022 RepID=A0A8C7VX08_ONCMY|nr:kinesin-like protein KIF18A isoform X1 [Oncorhynchus mykiss]XP_021463237.2 kinesin-like protein KIF18A isoform X1 [Oncorhynchus mykiss]XP_036836798.1 kinesin-like protein KIF18A isoform X1 [Oncorhynchus mykiss]